jgi:hypothetical protein
MPNQPTEFAPPPAPPPPQEAALCRVVNPSARARVLYGGPRSDVVVHIPPGQTVEAVLAEPLIDRLLELENADPEEPGLKVTELGPPPAPPPKPERPSRRPRPAKAA